MPENELVIGLANRLSGRVMISSEINDSDLAGLDLESVTARIVAHFDGVEGLKLLDRATLEAIISLRNEEKAPVQVEIKGPAAFQPLAKEIEPAYSFRNADVEMTGSGVSDFSNYFNDRFDRIRSMIDNTRSMSFGGLVNNIEGIKQYTSGREVGIIGMVYDRIVTKNGNIMITLEDRSGTAKVIFRRPDRGSSPDAARLFDSASKIVLDEIVAVKGKISAPFVFANAMLWPDIPIKTRKQTEEDIAIAFTSDIHVGSKLFLEKQFGRFLRWINGDIDYRMELAGKVKYIVVSGDLVDGIGVYPNQDRELNIPDIYKQYSVLLDFLSNIPDYVHVFLLAGNHDAVRSAEPQPALTKDLIGEFEQGNIHFVSNPGRIIINGMKILGYHGTSLDSIIQGIPGCSYSKPESAMVEVLKRRHLSPIYGDTPIVPSRRDSLIIDEIPDILHMGHLHKNGYADYRGTLIVNGGTWQGRTSYQVKLGHMPTPAVLPVYETKTATLSSVDFNEMGS